MDVVRRSNVQVHGPHDGPPMIFSHGFGCDQNMWRYVPSASGLQVGGDWYDAFAIAEDRIATVAYAEIDVARGAMVLACAGHMPPALIVPGEPARYVMEGALRPARRLPDLDRAAAERGLLPGRRVARVLHRLADEVTAAMLGAVEAKDDVRLVAARWTGPG